MMKRVRHRGEKRKKVYLVCVCLSGYKRMEEGTKEGGEGRGRGESKGQGMEKEEEEETANMEEKGKTLTLAKIIRLFAVVLKHFFFF